MPNANNYPLFVQNQRTSAVACSTAATTTAPGANALALGTIGANGGVLTKVSALPFGTVTACLVYLYYSKDNGVTKNLFAVAFVPLYSASASNAPTETVFNFNEDAPKRFAGGDIIYAGISSAQAAGIIVNAEWGDF